MSTQAVPGELRSSFVSATGTAKNLGKFLGPTAVGLLVLAVPLGTAFLSLGVVALGAVALVPPLRALDDHLTAPGRPGLDPLSVA